MNESPDKTWVAVYDDQSVLRQRENGQDVHSYHDIDQETKQVQMFMIVGKDGKTELVCMIPKEWRLIYRCRTFQHSTGRKNRVWIVGAQARDQSGKQFISVLYDDGRIVTTDRFNDDIPELAPPTIRPDRGEQWDFPSQP